MTLRGASLVIGILTLGATLRADAQDATPSPAPRPTATADPEATPTQVQRQEVVVVGASKLEASLIDAPATLSVLGTGVLTLRPAQNYGDLLRTVPGMNVIQRSPRDVNGTSRQSTGTLGNTQLALVDGRSFY